jgi:hypothetical protein
MNLKTLLIITLSLGLANCASITQGTTQSLIFDLDPSTTRCSLTREGDGEIGSISSKNNTLSVGKDKDDIVVKCNAPGYKQKTMRLVSSVSSATVVGGLFLDLGITDMITGAAYQYPTQTSIALDKE